jgi:hypothetical protein
MLHSPISLPTVFGVSLALFLYLFILGEGIRRIAHFRINELDERIIVDLALGTAGIPVLELILSPFKLITPIPLLTALIIMVLYSLKIPRLKSILYAVSSKAKALKISQVALICILCFSLLMRLSFTIGMYVHPGDDAKMHSLLVKRIAEEHSYPSSWGVYAPLGLETHPITYLMGFHGICSAVYFLLFEHVPVEQVVFLVSQIYNWLISLSLYLLVKELFSKDVGIVTAVTLSILPFPLGMVTYGGNAELPALFLMFILLSLILTEKMSSKGGTVVTSLILTGMFLTHVTVSLISLLLLFPKFISCCIKRRKVVLRPLLTALSVALILLAFHKHNLLLAEGYAPINRQFTEYFSTLWWEYDLRNIISGVQSLFQKTFLFEPILLFYFVIILGTGLILTLQIFSSVKACVREKLGINFIFYWYFVLLLLIMNNSVGLYFVKFPGWYIFIPGKLMGYLIYPATISICYISMKVYANLSKAGLKNIIRIIALILLFVMVSNDLYLLSWARNSGEPITVADLKAFEWIEQNIPQSSTFLVTDSDAGQWIPVFTGRRVIPMFVNFQGETIVNETSWEEIYLVSGFHNGLLFNIIRTDPNSPLTLQLLKKYNVEYAYVGSKKIYGRTIDLSILETVKDNYIKKIYEEEGVKIYRIEY